MTVVVMHGITTTIAHMDRENSQDACIFFWEVHEKLITTKGRE